MKIIIKIDNLDIGKEEFDKIISNLEEMAKIEPSQEIEDFSKKMKWSIDQKDISVKGSKIRETISYRIEFYHNEKEDDKKKCYLGSINYDSPVNPNK
jgi:hypothetical protein